jgi:hypothetical protein
MLTIKAIGLHGDEAVFQAAYLIRGEAREQGSLGALEFYNDGHGSAWQPIHYGQVYVMNEAGKTVAKYDITDPTRLPA